MFEKDDDMQEITVKQKMSPKLLTLVSGIVKYIDETDQKKQQLTSYDKGGEKNEI